MIKPGVASVTFRKKSPREVVEITKRAGLYAIEWGSDVHVPQGEVSLAREVRDMTISAGLEVPSYGSYYQMGSNAPFEPFIESAQALGAQNIRVWAGTHPSATIPDDIRENIINDARRISTLASQAGITVSTEYHNDSMTDSADAAIAFLNAVDHENFYTYWQQPLELASDRQLPELLKVIATGRLKNVHVFQYRVFENGREQLGIEDGRALWQSYFDALRETGVSRYAFLEFVRDGSDEAFLADAKTLLSL